MPTVNEDIRDDSIARDLTNQRVAASVQNQVDARLAQLENDLQVTLAQINPMGKRGTARAQAKLLRTSNALINEAYADCAQITREAMGRSALAESESSVMDIEDALP